MLRNEVSRATRQFLSGYDLPTRQWHEKLTWEVVFWWDEADALPAWYRHEFMDRTMDR